MITGSSRRLLVGLALVLAFLVPHGVGGAALADTPDPASPARQSAQTPDRDFPVLPRSCRNDGASKICRITRFAKRPWLVLWGDSHALQYLTPLTAVARHRRVNLVAIYSGGCPLSVPFPAASGEPHLACDTHNERALDHVLALAEAKPRVRVVLGSHWHYYRSAYAQLVEEERTGEDSGLSDYVRHVARLGVERSPVLFRAIGAAGIPADVLAQSGIVPNDAPPCAEGEDPYVCDLPRRQVLPRERDNRRWLKDLSRALPPRPLVIEASGAYCDPDTCFGQVGDANTFYDRSHLGERMSRSMRQWFRPTVRALVHQPSSRR